jgi:peptide chain release factor 1
MMFEKLEAAENRYEELNHKLSDIKVINDQETYRELMKEHSELEPLIAKLKEYRKYTSRIREAEELLEDEIDTDFRELVESELQHDSEKLTQLQKDIRIMLLPKDHSDEKSVIIEIRAGAGGEEAALFGSVLYKMYSRYAEKKGWITSILDVNETEIGGFKEVIFLIEGKGAFSKFKYESGVHRVQRVPATEAGGRIHTSTVTVAVLPEAEEVEVDIDPGDIRVDTYRASGAGGQHINKTDSAIRITHIPTGIVVACQDERSQHKNKDKAMRILRAKLNDLEIEKQDSRIASERKSQVGRGNRNERIRTYNYPQGRVTDHRIGLTLYKLDSILEGSIDEVIEALFIAEQTEKLAGMGVE